MDTIKTMRIFVRVAECGSFTTAAEHLDLSPPYISRAIGWLESHLRTRLLHRTTRRVSLTDAGERYYQRCRTIVASVDEAESEARNATLLPSGTLRVRAMTGFGQQYVVRAFGEYQALYPDVRIELSLGQGMPDLLDERYDLALVAATTLPDSAMVSQQIGEAFSIACAAPSYIEKRGEPTTPADLRTHRCVQLDSPVYRPDVWTLDGPDGEARIQLGRPELVVNTTDALATSVKEGQGIGLIPFYSAVNGLKSGELVWILRAFRSQKMNLYAVYPSRQFIDAKTRTVVEHLKKRVPEWLGQDQRGASLL